MQSVESPSVTRLGAEETRRTFPPRRRLNQEQEREVTRLYAETMLSVPDISKQFSIGESSVYRIAQRNGAGLRGRTASASSSSSSSSGSTSGSSAPATPAPVRRTRRTRTTGQNTVAAPVTPVAAPGRRRRAPAAAAVSVAPAVKTTRRGRRPSVGLQRFEIQYRAQTVVRAANVSAALRQVEALGATDVLAIVRQDS